MPELPVKLIWKILTLREAALDLGMVTGEQYDQWVIPEKMTGL